MDAKLDNGMRRILFVDDEPVVLEGLKNLGRKHRRRWEMSFALGGNAALGEQRSGTASGMR
jgi:hypothetical protein